MSFAPMTVGPGSLSLDTLVSWAEREAQRSGEGCGALVTFLGVVRATHQSRRVRYLEYEAHAALALNVLGLIGREVAAEWPDAILAIHHRTGRLEVGEASVAIVAATAHRAAAFQVCRYAIERVKQIAPVWKHEFFEGGEAWVEGPVADPTDVGMRQEALGRACA
jgi:molybdopterin synthase catalytic subunit